MKLTKFNTLTTAQFNSAVSQFTGSKAATNYLLYCDFLANSVAKYFEHKDATHLNRAIEASRYFGMYRLVSGFMQSISAHKSYSKGVFTGKMDSNKMELLENVNDNDVLEWEQRLFDMLGAVSAKQTERDTPKKVSKKDAVKTGGKSIESAIRKLGESGLTLEEVDALYFEIRAKFEVSQIKAVA